MQTRRQFMKKMGLAAGMLYAGGCIEPLHSEAGKTRSGPNILFIMSDDHACNAISSYGGMLSKLFRTPNIDRIAKEGVRLDNCFVTNSICTPSRAAILTGKYSHRNGVYTLKDDFDRSQPNVAGMLQQAGYETAMVGKWHLHTEPSGFDYYNVLPGQGRYHNPIFKEKGKGWKDHNAGGERYEGYCTDVITDIALKWLDGRDKSKPFFLMCHHKAPHGLWEYAGRHENMFDGIEIPEPASLWEDKSHRSEGSRDYGRTILTLGDRMNPQKGGKPWPTGRLDTTGMTDKQQTRTAYQKYMKDYLRTLAAIDENVGRVLDYLDEKGLADSTVVIYTSDQGQLLGEHSYYDKRWMFEESLRMPFLARCPKEIPAGSANDDMVLNIDFAETFLDYADAAIPKDMQGRSFRSNLKGRTPAGWRGSMYYRYWMHMGSNVPAHYGVRTKAYKLIFFYGMAPGMKGANEASQTPAGWELYDLRKDPLELHNVYDDPAYGSVVKELKKELFRLKKAFGDTDEKYPELMEVRKRL